MPSIVFTLYTHVHDFKNAPSQNVSTLIWFLNYGDLSMDIDRTNGAKGTTSYSSMDQCDHPA